MPEGSPRSSPSLDVPRLDTSTSFAKEAYAALKRAITAIDIYDHPDEVRLDERRLSQDLGVSRTPIREAMTLLEQEGFVRTRPRRGIYVVKKTKREIVEIITVMAALESMAARLAAERATDAEIAELRRLMDEFRCGNDGERLDEYSDANIAFHQAIIRMSGCALLAEMTENLFIHMRAIRKITIHQENRAARSITDHMRIIEALEGVTPSSPSGWRASTRWGSPRMSSSTAIFSTHAMMVERHSVIRVRAKARTHFAGAGCLPFGSVSEHGAAGSSLAEQWVPASAGTPGSLGEYL
jgi:DNA-binding GntR family transcriptional regulator